MHAQIHKIHHLCSGNSTTLTRTPLSRAQVCLLTANNCLRLLHNLLTLGQDQLDVAWVGHVWVDLSTSQHIFNTSILLLVFLTRPWARYVRRRCFGAWLTWMCLTIKFPVSRPLVSAFASAFLSKPRRNSADLTGHLARVTPNCLPAKISY
jgi:hypothetical protein